MRLLGFNLKKIEVERFSDSFKDLNINTNIHINSIKIIDSPIIKGKEETIQVDFTYTISYEEKIAKIEIKGNIFISLETKTTKEVLKYWEENKISDHIKIPLFNFILKKSNVKALQLEDEVGLPFHIPFPLLKQDTENK